MAGATQPVHHMSTKHDYQPAQGRNQRSRRRQRGPAPAASTPARKPVPKKKPGLIGKILGLVGLGGKGKATHGKSRGSTAPARPSGTVTRTTIKGTAETKPRRTQTPRKPESVEVTGPRLYIGNLSYDASDNDLTEVFNGVGRVQSVEIVTNQRTQRSKGYGFVEMGSVEEALRAVAELHDKEFMGRKMVVSGAKPRDEQDAE